MTTTFWVNEKELDETQRGAIQGRDEKANFLVRGPAGSGKTNILLLRAKWYLYKKLSDINIVVFTGSLKRHVQLGCIQYGIPPEVAITCIRFFQDLLKEYHVDFELSGNFEIDRAMLAGKTLSLIESQNISNIKDAILVDECQDYTDTELIVLRKLTCRLILVADSRQSIYQTTHSPELLEKLVDQNVVHLKYHYRSGLNICLVADAILKDSATFSPVHKECKYDEATKPSSVTLTECKDLSSQIRTILEKLPGQLDLYPGELIGVLFPKNDQLALFIEAFSVAPEIEEKERVITETMHGAKGLEFRSVHVGGIESLYRMGPTQKRLAYTSILRGKTSVALYTSGSVPGYLESALARISPPVEDPNFSSLFVGK